MIAVAAVAVALVVLLLFKGPLAVTAVVGAVVLVIKVIGRAFCRPARYDLRQRGEGDG